MTRHQEIERKFDVDPAAPFPDLSGASGAVGEVAESQLDATYFDTDDAQLAKHNITLRRRTGGSDAGWHLKLPAGQDERTEVRLPLGRSTRTVPVGLTREVRAVTRDRALVPIARLHTTRRERQLLDASGTALAILADDTVHAERLTPGGIEVSSWREIEVELVEGDRAFLDTVASRLRAAGLTPSASTSKLARVLGDLVAPHRADASGPSKARRPRRPTAGAVVLRHLQEQVDQLVLRDRDARGDAPGGVHQMRVATRRLRSALATFRPLLHREQTDPVREELKWLGQVLGQSRDAEVLHSRLSDQVAALPRELVLGPVVRRVDRDLRARRRVARAELLAALESERYFRLLDTLDALLADPPLTARARKPAVNALPALVGRAASRVDRAARAVAQNATTEGASHEGLHEVRKSAKRARYAAEAAAPVVGKPAERLARRMTSVQDVLGEYQDSVAARVLLRELAVAAHLSGENTFTFGVLHAQEGASAEREYRSYHTTLGKASTTKVRHWAR